MISEGVAFIHESLRPLMVPIDSIKPDFQNYNSGDVDKIAESIETNGVYRPIYVRAENRTIVAGHHVHEALRLLGAQNVPALMLDIDEVTAKKIMIADNRIASLAMPDNALLLNLLQSLAADDSITGTGYAEHDVEVLENLAKIPLDHDEFGQWKTVCFQLPPHAWSAFYNMTREAVGDRERLELIMRLAGWDGSDPGK